VDTAGAARAAKANTIIADARMIYTDDTKATKLELRQWKGLD